MEPRPALVQWLTQNPQDGDGKRALVIACGLGDDAEALAALGFDVTAFDIAPTAIEWCNKRFPDSSVDYHVADMFDPPAEWIGAFDFVLEIFTVQALPIEIRPKVVAAIKKFVVPKGYLLVIAIGLDVEERKGPPWPLTSAELKLFENEGLIRMEHNKKPIRPDANRATWQVTFRLNAPFEIGFDMSKRTSLEPHHLRSHFFNQFRNSKFHWFFMEAVDSYQNKLYISSILCILNGIEASLRVTLRQKSGDGIYNSSLGKTLNNKLLREAKSIGIPVGILRLPGEDKAKFDKKMSPNGSTKPVDILQLRHEFCHGNLSEYLEKISDETAYFEPAMLHNLNVELLDMSHLWANHLSSWRFENLVEPYLDE